MTTFEQPGALRAALVSGLRWKVVGQATTQASRILVTVVLARLLLPRDFGLAGMVLVFAGMIQVFADVGFSAGIIQHKTITDADRTTAFWTNVFVGVVLTAIGISAAPYAARFYGEPTLKPLFIALSLTFAIAALGSTQAALLRRDMRFRELEVTASIASVAGAAVAVASAFAGAGPWALILQAVVTALTTTTLLWVSLQWRPRLVWSRASLRKLWGFGASVFGANTFGFLSRDSDNFLVGRFLGAQALGTYSMAYSVIAMPFDRLLAPVQALLTPMFAKLQDDLERTRGAWLQGTRMCVAAIAPLAVGVMVLAPVFVSVVLGDHWLSMVPVLEVLAYVACIQSATTLTPIVLLSRYRTTLLLRVTLICFVAHLCGFVVGLHWGVLGVAVGYAISNTVIAVPLQVGCTARVLEASVREVRNAVAGVLVATAGMAAFALTAQLLTDSLIGGQSLRLTVGVVIGALSYALLIVWREPRLLREFSMAFGRSHALLSTSPMAVEIPTPT